jgi:agmatinase
MRILKFPLNAGGLSKRDGVELGPDAVEKHLDDFYLNEAGLMSLFDVSEIKLDNSNLEEAHKHIYHAVDKLGASPAFSILLGGDHSMTYPAFKAFAKNNPGTGLVIFDAHPDTQETQYPPTHEDYLKSLIEEGTLDPHKVIIVGTRNMSKEERKYIEDMKIKHYSMREIGFEGIMEVSDAVMSASREWPKTYLSIDIDVLDPAFAPGTGYTEPGGLTTRELIYFIQRMKLMRNLAIADVVEVNPKKDMHEITAKTAAKLIVELS